MPIRFTCSHCGQRLSVSTQKAGREVKCPTCRRTVMVPPETSPPSDVDSLPSDEMAEALGQLRTVEPESELVYAVDEDDRVGDAERSMVRVPRRVLYLQGFLLGAVALVFFVFGLIVGSHSSPEAERTAANRPCILSGTVVFEPGRGERLPDTGSVAFVLPASTRPDQKATADGLAPRDPDDETHPGVAAVRAIGGDYCRVDRRGRYRLQVPGPGRYYLLIVSCHQQRPESEQPKARDLAEMGRYLLSPTGLLGNQQYDWKELLIRGDQQLDLAF